MGIKVFSCLCFFYQHWENYSDKVEPFLQQLKHDLFAVKSIFVELMQSTNEKSLFD